MKRIGLVFILLLVVSFAKAQDAADVLRLSQNHLYGTSRYVGMGGAFGALGADFTSLSYNPAGLGVYRSSEFTITPTLKSRLDNTNYLNSPFEDKRTRVMFDNLGIVGSYRFSSGEEELGLVMLNFGVGYNRINDFYSETNALGRNTNNSIMDHFANQAQGVYYENLTITDDDNFFFNTLAPWDAILAWNNFLIDTVPGNPTSYWAALNDGDGVDQDQTLSSIGGIGEYTFSIGGNVSNKFYFGATLGIQNVYFRQKTFYSESALSSNQLLPNGDLFHSMYYNQTLTVEGYGLNFKVGVIYRPIPELRLGVAAHTPTFYDLSERYNAVMGSDFFLGITNEESPLNAYDYKIETPFKLIGSAAYTFGKIGLLSVDYEYVDYSTMRFGKGGDGYRFTNENATIKSEFSNTFNLRAGGEVWVGKMALRGGYAYYGSPYSSGSPYASSHTNIFSGGFGFRINSLFLDWAYQRLQLSDKYSPYPGAPIVNRDVAQNRFMMTVGYKF
ncbi:MAG: hypothetical protein RBT19_10535 [Tenuifilaceae bacterium]|jgi:hypothetical protein|nr:hypothetical protein [Tenuifilaceae bacterium]